MILISKVLIYCQNYKLKDTISFFLIQNKMLLQPAVNNLGNQKTKLSITTEV